MRITDKLRQKPASCDECWDTRKHALHEIARLRSMLFQFLTGDDTPEFRVKVANILGIAHMVNEVIPDRITDDKQFSSLHDEN